MAVEGKLKTAEALDEKAIAAIREQFEKQIGEEISFKTEVDPTLLGGFVVTLGGKVYDRSVRSHLKNIKTFIHHTAQTARDVTDLEDGSIELHFDTKAFGEETRTRIGEYVDMPETAGIGTVISSGDGIVIIEGLDGCKYGELVVFEGGDAGIVMNLSKERIGAVLLSNAAEVSEGIRTQNGNRRARARGGLTAGPRDRSARDAAGWQRRGGFIEIPSHRGGSACDIRPAGRQAAARNGYHGHRQHDPHRQRPERAYHR